MKNQEQQKPIDWVEESKNLKEPIERDWWTPEQGQHQIELLSEGEAYTYTDEKKDVEYKKIRFHIKVDNKERDWSINYGQTPSSMYGQLSLLIANTTKKATGTKFNLLRKGEGTDTQYTIIEALPFLPKKKKENK